MYNFISLRSLSPTNCMPFIKFKKFVCHLWQLCSRSMSFYNSGQPLPKEVLMFYTHIAVLNIAGLYCCCHLLLRILGQLNVKKFSHVHAAEGFYESNFFALRLRSIVVLPDGVGRQTVVDWTNSLILVIRMPRWLNNACVLIFFIIEIKK